MTGMHDLSPAVERAIEAAGASPTLADWLRILLADDEGRPAMLLERLGIASAVVIQQLTGVETTVLHGDTLLRVSREESVRLRADPSFTTDVLLLAVLKQDLAFADGLGVSLERMEAALRSPLVSGPTLEQMPAATFAMPEVTDRSDALRIVDANLNRARESLRVLDDYARFTRNDSVLTERVKSLRHRLAEASASVPLPSLLASRDTMGDVGTNLTAPGEYDRGSPAHVAAVNCKRLQEALRSVEEYGKVVSPHLAREAEAIRYECYSLERALLGGSSLRERLNDARLYLLAGAAGCVSSLDWTIAEAVAGGVGVVQLREKSLPDAELLSRAKQVREWTREANALFIVNDRPDIARLCDADGVHLGQDDLPIAEARRILGAGPLIGISTHTVGQVSAAVRNGADYLGIGPCFPSVTKSFESLAGLEFVKEAIAMTSLPMFALGGINEKTIPDVVSAGATRVAVSAAICSVEEPRIAAARLRSALDGD